MRRGICVKCGAASVRAAANGFEREGHVKARLRPHLEPGFRGAVQLQPADVWAFACTSCGYVEEYLLDAQAIAFVQQSWMPIAPQAGAGSPPGTAST